VGTGTVAGLLPAPEGPFPSGDGEQCRTLVANYSSFRHTCVPQPGTPDPIYQENKGPSVATLFPFASLLLPLLWWQQQATLPAQCTGEQGAQLGAQQSQGRGSGRRGLKELRTTGVCKKQQNTQAAFGKHNRQEIWPQLSCAKPWRNSGSSSVQGLPPNHGIWGRSNRTWFYQLHNTLEQNCLSLSGVAVLIQCELN